MADLEHKLNAKNSAHSSLRESIIEHLFVGEILKALWREDMTQVEVLKPQVDDAGYDVVIECNRNLKLNTSIPRYIQLKSTYIGGKRDSVSVGMKLAKKPNWCVIWIFFDPETLGLGPFRWFGTALGQPAPEIGSFKPARQTKGDSKGHKAEKPEHREVPKSKFVELKSIQAVIDRLFPKE